jgi:hypothetical protein
MLPKQLLSRARRKISMASAQRKMEIAKAPTFSILDTMT